MTNPPLRLRHVPGANPGWPRSYSCSRGQCVVRRAWGRPGASCEARISRLSNTTNRASHDPGARLRDDSEPDQYTLASHVRINSLGFRGPELRTLRGTPLLFCVGDSMTYGVGVEDEETFCSRLERRLAGDWPQATPEAINMGVQRYYTFQEIDLLRLHAPRLRPEIVILAVFLNDLGARPSSDYTREYEKEREQAATAFRNVAPQLYLLIKNSALIALLRENYLAWGSRESSARHALQGIITDRDERDWRGLEQELSDLKKLSDEHRFHSVVLFIPARPQVENDLPKSMYPRRLMEYAQGLGLVTLNPLDTFRAVFRAGDDPYLAWNNHMSPTGHRIVAETISSHLRQNRPALRTAADPPREPAAGR